MQDREWVFKQKRSIPLVEGRTVGCAEFSLIFCLPPSFLPPCGAASAAGVAPQGNLLNGFCPMRRGDIVYE